MNYQYDESINDEQKAVVTIKLDDQSWIMDYDEYQKCQEEGKTEAVTIGDRLKFVTPEDLELLKVLSDWIKNNGNYEL